MLSFRPAIKRDNKWWVATCEFGGFGHDVDVEITAEGIEINFQLIPWAELEAARQELGINKDEHVCTCGIISREPRTVKLNSKEKPGGSRNTRQID